MPRLEDFMAASLACLEVPALIEPNMPSANNAIWSLGELMVKIAKVVSFLLGLRLQYVVSSRKSFLYA